MTNLPFPKQALVFTCLQYKSFENTAEKGEIAGNEQFLLFPQCFLPFSKTFSCFHQISNGRLQTPSVWKSLKFAFWERVKDSSKLKELADDNFRFDENSTKSIQMGRKYCGKRKNCS